MFTKCTLRVLENPGNNAVSSIIDYLAQNGYSAFVIYAHSQSYALFKTYMTENGTANSHEVALQWLRNNRDVWKHEKYKYCR